MSLSLKQISLGVLGAAIAAVLPGLAAAAPAPPKTTIERGRALYVSVGCYQCHGHVGQGSTFSGAPLAPAPLGPGAFQAAVRTPRAVMPAYSQAVLPNEQLEAIYAYLKSIPPGRSPDEIPLLGGRAVRTAAAAVPERGAALYATHCAACHGPQLEGGGGAALTAEAVKRNGQATISLIKAPPPGMPKLHPAPLSDADVAAVAAFVRRGR